MDAARLQQLALTLPVPVAYLGPARRYVLVNDAYARLFARRPEDIVGRTVGEVLGAEHDRSVAPHIDAALAGGQASVELQIAGPGGARRHLEVTFVADRRPDGMIAGCFSSIVDVTEHRRAEHALRESECLFREMTDGLPLIVWVHDAEGEQEFVNATFCEFFGVGREAMKGSRWQVLMHPDDAEPYTREFARCVRERREFHAEVRVKRSDGEWRRIESWARPRFTPSGEFRGFVGTSVDITVRAETEQAMRRSEQALRYSEERFRRLADAMPQLVWVARDDGAVLYYNSRMTQYGGLAPGDGGEWDWQPVVHPDDRDATLSAWQAAVESGRDSYECEHRLCMADGSFRWHLSRAYRSPSPNGSAHWFGTATDIHDVKEAHEALREADRRKDDFLAMLGHELRNPLAAIRNAIDVIRLVESGDSRTDRAYGVLERQTEHMARLLDDLLEVSRIARGKIQLERRPLDLRDLVESVLHDRGRDIARAGLAVEQRRPAEPLWVDGDPVRLTQVFDNLISNALKFTAPQGVIGVELRAQGSEALVVVRDTGMGIQPEFLPRIFEPFQQELRDGARKSSGLGLGLALAKGLVEVHSGAIEARSAGAGQGAEFRVRLPLSSAPERPSAPPPSASPHALRILVVEDNDDIADMLRELLERRGHEVALARSGAEGLAHLRQEHVDIALCDLGLPDMNGHELARAVRADDAVRGIALVALTGWGQPDDRKRTHEAGFDEHLVKPVNLALLDSVLQRFARRV